MKLFSRVDIPRQYETEKKFKEDFVVTFLATWVANGYDDVDTMDLLLDPPVEDAEHLAEAAWDKVKELIVEAPEEKSNG